MFPSPRQTQPVSHHQSEDVMLYTGNLPKRPGFFRIFQKSWRELRRRFNAPYLIVGLRESDIPPDAESNIVGFVTTTRGGFPILRDKNADDAE